MLFSTLSQNPVEALPVGSKSRAQYPFDLNSRRSISIRSQNPVAQYPFDLKIPLLNIHSISISIRSQNPVAQNPVAQNPIVLKILSLKIHLISKSRRKNCFFLFENLRQQNVR